MSDKDKARELKEEDLEILAEYRNNGKLHPEFLPVTTYDLVQSGYPVPNKGVMVARGWGGSDAEGRLLPSNGQWIKRDDYLNQLTELQELKDRVAKLQAFKDYVHQRLDEAGIEKEPEGEHSKAGCRIGDRLDIVLNQVNQLNEVREILEQAPELNMGNYSDEQVDDLNNAVIEALNKLKD